MELSKYDVVQDVAFKSEAGNLPPVGDGRDGGGDEASTLLNNAVIFGEIDPAILSRRIRIAKGRGKEDKHVWPVENLTVQALIEKFSTFERGPKEGPAYLQGAVVAGTEGRDKKSMEAMDLLMLDIDNGTSMQEVIDKISAHKLFAILYSTHSNLKPQTEIPEAALLKWMKDNGRSGTPSTSDAIGYLLSVRGYKPDILDGAQLGARKQVPKTGFVYAVTHAPMPRIRVVLLLDKTFVFAERGGTQTDALTEWSERYLGTATLLDVPVDKSCATADRLMYTPRLPAMAEIGENKAEIVVLAGMPVDLDAIPRVSARPGKATGDPFSAFERGGSGKSTQGTAFKTPNLQKFLAIAAHDFEASDWMQSLGVEPRHEHPDGMDCACPNEDSHTTPDSKDRAFSIRNASGNAAGTGFSAWCLHDGCKQASGGDRAWYLDEVCKQHGITDAMDLITPEWTPNVWREREAEKQKATGGGAASGALSAVYVTADQLEAKPVKWVFADHLPKGCASLLVGPTKVGKSQQAIHMVACVTTGRPLVPGGASTVPAKAVLITAEDAHAEVVVPRLEAAGADMSKVVIVQGMVETSKDGTVTERALSLETAATALADVLATHPDVALVVVDPVNAHLGKIDARENNKVRAAMQPLISMADKHGLSVLLVHHMRKDTDTSNLLDMSGGSNAFVEATRTVFVCVPVNKERPEEDGAIFEVARSSYARSGQRYLYHIEPVDLPPWGISTSRVVFSTEKAPMSAAQAVLGNNKREDATELERTVEFLGGYLGDGNEHDADEVRAAARNRTSVTGRSTALD